jgi:hypothetical protein
MPTMTDMPRDARFDITAAHLGEPRWRQQLDELAAAGASFDGESKTWFLWVGLEPLPVDTLNKLFRISSAYGTRIQLTLPAKLNGRDSINPPA